MIRRMSDVLSEIEIIVQVTRREDGGLRVRSRDLPGVLLGGSDPHRIWATVGDVVEHAVRHGRGLDVRRVIGPMTAPTAPAEITLRVQYAATARAAA